MIDDGLTGGDVEPERNSDVVRDQGRHRILKVRVASEQLVRPLLTATELGDRSLRQRWVADPPLSLGDLDCD